MAAPAYTKKSTVKARHKLFIDTYLSNGMQAAPAYQVAYPTCTLNAAYACAHRLLKSAKVQTLIDEALHTQHLVDTASKERILAELSRIAFGNATDVADWQQGTVILKDSADLSEDVTATITEINEIPLRGGGSRLQIKRADKLKALELLSKYHGLLTDKCELSGHVDVQLTMAELAALATKSTTL